MYIPRFNAEERPDEMHAMMRAHPLATLVTMHPTGLFATHLPLILHVDGAAPGILRGHMARANAQWKDPDPAVEVLAIFTGAHHYVSPSWYPSKAENHRSVPTWNYIAVHAYGPLRVIEDAAWLRTHLEALTATHESPMPLPWKITDAPEEYIAAMLRGIVGVEIPITRLEGKWKLSQNRDARDREGVAAGLDSLGTPGSEAMAEEMRRR